MIPKTFHLIWVGDSPLPAYAVENRNKLIALHPKWEICFWEEHDGVLSCGASKPTTTRHPDLMKRACHPVQRANIWRLEVLYKYGGVYMDMDIEPLAAMDQALEGSKAAVSRMFHSDQVHNNSFMAAEPHHPWMKYALESIAFCDPNNVPSMSGMHMTNVVHRHPDVTVLGKWVIVQDPAWPYQKRELPKQTVAVHHFAGSWKGA